MPIMIKNNLPLPLDPDGLPKGKGLVYEVIRVIDSTPLFFQGHYDRMLNSLRLTGSDLSLSLASFREMVDLLMAKIGQGNFNFKVLIDPATKDIYLFENPSAYPSADLYRAGIHTEILKYERPDPNAKVMNTELVVTSQQLMAATDAYEVLLEDSEGHITEGSKSNVFFMKEGVLYTPPLFKVLPGITRLEIIACARDLGMTVREENIPAHGLHDYDAAFISGTSPKILPIHSVGLIRYDFQSNSHLTALIRRFDQRIVEDLQAYRKLS